MLPTTIRSPPSLDDFTLLSDFQSQTPNSFVDGKPILHLHLTGVTAQIPKSVASQLGAVFSSGTTQGSATNGTSDEVLEQEVDVFVSSETFTIFSSKAEAGASIPYPSISIHAIKPIKNQPSESDENRTLTLWMMLDFASQDGGDDDDDFSSPELTLIPKPSTESIGNPAQELYDAIANCSNLHFDEGDEEEEEDDRIIYEGSAEHQALEGFSGVLRGASDGSLPPPMPGSGGWITAENVHQYFDGDGNWIGPGAEDQEEELGEGAGRTRPHDEVDGGETNGDTQEDTKRPRVDDQAPSSR